MTFVNIANVTVSADAARRAQQEQRRDQASRAYRAARRHSRLVRCLRLAIPLGAVLSFAGFIVLPFINPFRAAGVSVGAVKMDGTRVTMEQPRLAGHRKDNKPYEVTAVSAVQDIRIPNIIELNEMTARLVNTDDSVLNLTAKKAVFDSQKEQLKLRDDVRLRTQAGQEAFLKSADVDFKAGTVTSREAVTVRLPDMSVSADGLEVVDNGAQIAFVGRVSALIDDKDSARAAAAPPATPKAATPPAPVSSPAASGPRGAISAAPAVNERGVTVIDPATGRAVPVRPAP
jgi:lipopolysaccharide export system protein LptC